MATYSYSAVKDFQGCARRYQQVRVLRRFRSQPTEATLYGERVHKAFELYLMEGTPLPEDLQRHEPLLKTIASMSGVLSCELKLGMRKDFTPCAFDDPEVWIRGIPDVLIVNESKQLARCIDFKTGKSSRYADTAQLELMAALIMTHYPAVSMVRGMLAFVVAGSVVKIEHTRERLSEVLSRWAGYVDQIQSATDHDTWNPTPSGLCKFCPVSHEVCEYRSG